MIKSLIHSLTIFCVLVFMVSCDRADCKNTNKIFDSYTPNTNEYKKELAHQLAQLDASKLSYWMDTYQEENNASYITANVQGEGLCAKIYLTIQSNKGIEKLLEHKGKGYAGAKLKDLKFDIKTDSSSTEFLFQEVSGITD